MLDTTAVSHLLMEIGQRMELAGELPFKARAYYTAAENLMAITTPLSELIAKGKLRDIPGVGEAIAEKIIKLHKTGTHPTLEFLREQFPAGVLEIMRVPGLGPKKAAVIYNELKITSLLELEEACKAGRLKEYKGLGAKLEIKILQGIEFMRKASGQRFIDAAQEHLQLARRSLQEAHPEIERIEFAGSFRRGCEVVDDPSLVVFSTGPFQKLDVPGDVAVHVSDRNHFAATWLFATGSKAHLNGLCALASSRGMTLNARGLSREDVEIACNDERDIYAALGLTFIEPELRERRGEIELAQKGLLPKLVNDADIRGILHSHTDFSDGKQPLARMAEAVRERGYQYYGVADHSQSAGYAFGLKEERVIAQQQLADRLNAEYSGKHFRIFKGIESDILDDGSLDYPDRVLNNFDFVVASVHSRFNLDKQAQTQRLIKAVSDPHTTILGHPTGRLLLRREGYAMDMEEVLKACAKHGVVVEINAHPYRLDLDWRWHSRALELGCMLSINPDAHAIGEIDLVHWGVIAARKGGVPAERVLNCMDLDAITKYFEERKKRKL